MQAVGMETAQNVVLQHETASIGDRIVAYIIDTLVLVAWFFLWLLMMIMVGGGDAMAVIFMVMVLPPWLLYHLVSELAMDGQSIGKRARNIKVARIDGGQPGIGQYLLRWVLRPVDTFSYIGLVVVLINGRGQRLGDLAAGTTVISLKPRLSLKDTLVAEVADTHEVRFSGAIRLSDAQVTLIRDVLANTKSGDRWSMIEELATKVRPAVGDPAEGMRAQEFLERVLKDHVYLATRQGPGRSAGGDQRMSFTSTPG